MAGSDGRSAPLPEQDERAADLLRRARMNDPRAVADLYNEHKAVALYTARQVNSSITPDDVVHEAFAEIMAAFRRGAGPTTRFRAYFLVAVRRLAIHHAERNNREIAHFEVPDVRAIEAADSLVVNRDFLRRIANRMPAAHIKTLWDTQVEGYSPADQASEALRANTSAKRTWRAKEAARKALLLETVPPDRLDEYTSLIVEALRGTISSPGKVKLGTHIADCPNCTEVLALLTETNGDFDKPSHVT